MLVLLKSIVLLCFVYVVMCQEACEKIHMIYPKEGSILSNKKGSVYVVMGSALTEGFLTQVALVESETQKLNTVWTGRDELSKVLVVQQDLNQLELGSTQSFQFRALVEESGRQCLVESGKFTIH